MNAPQFLAPDADGVLEPHPVGLVEQSNDEYHGGPGISKSHLDAIASASPAHYWHRYLNPDREPEEPTPAKIMGTAVHSAILEPDLFPTACVAAPADINRRTNAGKAEWEAFLDAHKGKTILSAEDYKTCLAIRDAVHRHPLAAGLLTGGKAEQSFYAVDQETGELIKCRTDYRHDSGAMIVDVKTTDDASPAGFGKSAANYRYTVQTAWYNGVLDAAFGEHPGDWVFLAVEKDPPYAIGVYFTEPEQLIRASIVARRDFLRIVEHKRRGYWPDYATAPLPLALPSWSRL